MNNLIDVINAQQAQIEGLKTVIAVLCVIVLLFAIGVIVFLIRKIGGLDD